MSSVPLLTIGTLSYNTGCYVIEALECVKKQGYPNVQHIIVDDCSKDNSVALIEEWIRLNNYYCTFIKHEINKGVQFGLKEIFELARGKYIVFISDDLWVDGALKTLVKRFEELDDSYALVYGDTQMIDKDGNVIIKSMFRHSKGENFTPPSGNIFKEVVNDFYFWIQSSLISLKHFKKIGYKFDREIISEDWDWELALSRNFKIYAINRVYASYRYLETSITRSEWAKGRIKKVHFSHAKMLLNYFNHKSNDSADNDLIYNRVLKIYYQLIKLPNFNSTDHIRFVYLFIMKTKRLGLLYLALRIFLGKTSRRILKKL